MELDLQRYPHRRRNALTGEWILVSPHRAVRPWQGQVEPVTPVNVPPYDPTCYMCPGNSRANGQLNPEYRSTFVFTNDFPALQPDSPRASYSEGDLIVAHGETGLCRVVCFSPRHDVTFGGMSSDAIREVVDCWAQESTALRARGDIASVQIFENRGAAMGASNPHPHGQIWATSFVPGELAKEAAAQGTHHRRHGRALLADYAALEERRGERVILGNDHFLCVVPFWAAWPFETLVIARADAATLSDLGDGGRDGLADVLQRLTALYDRVFETPFPYSMGVHERAAGLRDAFRLHAHFYPPLLRSATVRKHMVGFELLATPQRDMTAEAAAAELRRAAVTPAAAPSATTTPTR